jgi:DNA repair exonuclease SbcCD ATPase subunit
VIKENIPVSSTAEKRLITQLPNPTVEAPLVVRNPDEYAAIRVMEAEMVELSERLRQARLQLEEERQKRHQIRDDYDETRRILEEERNKHRDTAKQLVILEEDQMTHQIQVSRLREQIEQNMSLKESLQLDLDRTRMQLHHAKEKYEAALNSVTAENEALRKKLDLTQVELQQSTSGSANKRDLIELESQNAVLRQVVDRYRRAMPSSRFGESADAASSTAFDSPKLLSQSDFVNALMEALDRTKFLNKQMLIGTDQGSNWSKQSWQDLCVGWREAVVELCDLFASAHRIESLQSGAHNNSA